MTFFAASKSYSETHDDDTKTGILVPLYKHPSPIWDELIQVKHAHPSVQILVIINPQNGPGAGSQNYVQGIKKLQSANIQVLGYIYTKYATRNSSEIIGDIDSYKNLYNVNGIFFDEMSHMLGKEDYYRHLNEHAKSIGIDITIGNPGQNTSPSYIGTVDNLVIYENSGLPSVESLGVWNTNYSKSNFSILSYNVSKLNEKFVRSLSHHAGFIYVTDQNLPNPWYSLPPYFNNLVSVVGSASDCEKDSVFPISVRHDNNH